MDKIDKALLKLPDSKRRKLLETFEKVVTGQTEGLNIKKMKGYKDTYRLKVADSRLIYRIIPGQEPIILFVGKRDDQTYRDF